MIDGPAAWELPGFQWEGQKRWAKKTQHLLSCCCQPAPPAKYLEKEWCNVTYICNVSPWIVSNCNSRSSRDNPGWLHQSSYLQMTSPRCVNMYTLAGYMCQTVTCDDLMCNIRKRACRQCLCLDLSLDPHILLNSVHTFYSVTCNSIRSMRWTNRLVRNSFRWQRWRQKTCHIFFAVYLGPEQSIPFELNTDPRDLRTFIWSHNTAMPGLRKFTKTTVWGAILATLLVETRSVTGSCVWVVEL